MGKSLDEVLSLDSRELIQWEIFDRVHGLPDMRQEAQLAQLTSVMANVFGGKTTPDDFMLATGGEKVPGEAPTEPSAGPVTAKERTVEEHRALVQKHPNVAAFEKAWAEKEKREQEL